MAAAAVMLAVVAGGVQAGQSDASDRVCQGMVFARRVGHRSAGRGERADAVGRQEGGRGDHAHLDPVAVTDTTVLYRF